MTTDDARLDLLAFAAESQQDLSPDLFWLIRRACATLDQREVQIGKLRSLVAEAQGAPKDSPLPDAWLDRARAMLNSDRNPPLDYIKRAMGQAPVA